MCLGTFSRLRRSLATSTLSAAVRILAERFLLYRKAISCKVKKELVNCQFLKRGKYEKNLSKKRCCFFDVSIIPGNCEQSVRKK